MKNRRSVYTFLLRVAALYKQMILRILSIMPLKILSASKAPSYFPSAKKRLSMPFIFILPLLFFSNIHAANWMITPQVSLSEIYTDNVSLAQGDSVAEEYITEVMPGVAIENEWGRSNFLLNYNMQNLYFSKERSRNATFHQLRTNAAYEVIPDQFLVDMRGSYFQQVLGDEEPILRENLSSTEDRRNVFTLGASPSWRYVYGAGIVVETRYDADVVRTENDIADVNTSKFSIDVNNRVKRDRFFWALGYSDEKIDHKSAVDSRFKVLIYDLRWQATRRLELLTGGGYEEVDFGMVIPESQIDLDGEFWNVGFGWRLDRYTRVEARAGERFFGDTYLLIYDREINRTRWRARYNEDVSTTSKSQIGQQVFESDEGLSVSRLGLNADLNAEAFVRKTSSLGYKYTGRKLVWEFNIDERRLEYQIVQDKERRLGVDIDLSLRVGVRTTLGFNHDWMKEKFRDGIRIDWARTASIEMANEITQRLTGTVEYRYTERDSNFVINDYKENVIRMQLVLIL